VRKLQRAGVRILKSTPWLDLKEMRFPSKGIKSYIFSHETRCDGRIVAIMPYKRTGGRCFYLLRREVTPPWDPDDLKMSSITGGVDRGVTPEAMALLELWEEAGYSGTTESSSTGGRWRTLGACYGVKSSDTVYSLFAVDVTGLKAKTPPGDGSELESKARNLWVTDSMIGSAVDPLVYILHYRTKRLVDRTAAARKRDRHARLNRIMGKLGVILRGRIG